MYEGGECQVPGCGRMWQIYGNVESIVEGALICDLSAYGEGCAYVWRSVGVSQGSRNA